MTSVSSMLYVFLGGGLGSVARHLIGQVFGRAGFPWATLCVNLVGSFVIGVLVRQFERDAAREPWKLFLIVGLLGGFTTFSAFSHDNLALIRAGSIGLAFANMVVQLGGGLALAALGYAMGQPVSR